MRSSPVIALKNVHKSYGTDAVLQNFSLDIHSGEFVTAIGTSGCGKTTILKLINGLIAPDQGEIYIDGHNIKSIDQNLLRRQIGYVIQSIGLFPHLRVKDNIAYILRLLKTDKKAMYHRVSELMEVVGLEPQLLSRYPNELSGGQKQRIGIARALSANPKIMLMDEPFGAVDDITRKALQVEMKNIQQQFHITIFFITHDITEALKLGSRVLVMNKGQIEQYDTPDEIRSNPSSNFVRQLTAGSNVN